MHGRPRHLATAPLALALLVLAIPSAAPAQAPNDSSVDQYLESVPGPGGDRNTSDPGGRGGGGGGGGGGDAGSGGGSDGSDPGGSSAAPDAGPAGPDAEAAEPAGGGPAESDAAPAKPAAPEPSGDSDRDGRAERSAGEGGAEPPTAGGTRTEQVEEGDDSVSPLAATDDPSVGQIVADALTGEGEMGLALPVLLAIALILALIAVWARLRPRRGSPE
jgi:hypothetical protein